MAKKSDNKKQSLPSKDVLDHTVKGKSVSLLTSDERRHLIQGYVHGIPDSNPSNNQIQMNLPQVPPKSALYLLYLFLPKKDRDIFLDDLTEEYQEVYETFGARLAAVWYCKQVSESLWPLAKSKIADGVKFIAGTKILSLLWNYIQWKISEK